MDFPDKHFAVGGFLIGGIEKYSGTVEYSDSHITRFSPQKGYLILLINSMDNKPK